MNIIADTFEVRSKKSWCGTANLLRDKWHCDVRRFEQSDVLILPVCSSLEGSDEAPPWRTVIW